MGKRDEFVGEVKVASSIVDFLSSGLYESPAACLKELVNNSYDADAKEVNIFVKPDANRIIVADDGTGFSKETFTAHFDRVSDSAKRAESDKTQSGRPKIGLIGIGFIAANEICEEMEIYSTVAGSRELLHVIVDFRRMREPQANRREAGGDVTKGDYYGWIEEAELDEHYTRIFLKEVRENAQEILVGAARARGVRGKGDTLYGMGPDSVRDVLAKANLRSWSEFDFYSQTMLDVGLNVPVRYHNGWVPAELVERTARFVKRTRALKFDVIYDGTELRKPIVFRPSNDSFLFERFEVRGTHVKADGYLYAQHGTLTPSDLNGVLIRIRHAAVGGHDPTFMEFPTSRYPLFQRWISGEIWASDELEDAMNIDRRTLRSAHPAYAELQERFHVELEKFLSRVRSELYGERTESRKRSRAQKESEAISEQLAKQRGAKLPADTKKRVGKAWNPKEVAESEDEVIRKLVKKYTVSEIYDLVLTVAEEVLTPRQGARFVDELTKRLRG